MRPGQHTDEPDLRVALSALREGNLAAAAAIAQRLLDNKPHDPAVHQLAAAIALQEGDTAQAMRSAAVSLARRPDHVPTLVIAGRAALARGRRRWRGRFLSPRCRACTRASRCGLPDVRNTARTWRSRSTDAAAPGCWLGFLMTPKDGACSVLLYSAPISPRRRWWPSHAQRRPCPRSRCICGVACCCNLSAA